MATRKTTTRGKTNTQKAKTTKSAKVTKPVPTKTAKVTKKTVAAKVSRGSSAAANILQLRRLLKISVFVYAALAALAVSMMQSATYEMTIGYLTKDTLLSRTTTVFAPAVRVLYDIEIRWALVVVLALSLILPILYLTRWENRYQTALKGRVLAWRWVDLAVTSALMLEIVALISGVQDVMTLKMIAGLAVVTCALGYIAERQNENATKPVLTTYVVSLFTGALPWLVIAVSLVATPLYGLVRSPWYTYALYAAGLISFGLLAYNQFNQHRRLRNWANYIVVERNYLTISLVSKIAFAAILIAGLKK